MLDSLYQTLFRPRSPLIPLTLPSGWGLMLLLSVLSGMGWAGRLGLGAAGMVLLSLMALGLYLLAWFFLSASITLLAELMDGQGRGPETMGTLAAALWPAMLFGPLAALGERFDRLAGLLGLVVFLWVVTGLVRAVAQVHRLNLGRAALCVLGACALAFLGLGAMIGAPVMLIALAIAA